jgi:uracil-DNA glycosylase
MSLIVPHIKSILLGVKPSWKKILLSKELKPKLDECFAKLDHDLLNKGVTSAIANEHGLYNYIRPAPEHILEAFKYFDFKNLRCIIVGQDPYTSPIDAHGLSFSSGRGTKQPPSLKQIMRCLVLHGLTKPVDNPNLTGWARQGLLLLNAFLTRTPNIKRTELGCRVDGNGGSQSHNLHPFWEEFTGGLISYITQHVEHDIYIMLWGNDAKALTRYITKNKHVHVLEWSHPSPLNSANRDESNSNNFIYCDHFKQVSRRYPIINWDPTYVTSENLSDQFWSWRITKTDSDPAKVSAYNEVSKLLDTNDPSRIYDDGTDTEENLRIRSFIQDKIAKKNNNQTPKSNNQTPESKLHPIVVYVDGGCRGNQIKNNPNAIGGWGVWFAPTLCGHPTLCGDIRKSGLLAKSLMAYDATTNKPVATGEFTRATNQRAELMAVLIALETLCSMNLSNVNQITLVTDSQQYVCSWLGGRLWREYNKDKKFSNVENKDLVILICRYIWNLARIFKPGCTFEASEFLIKDATLVVQHINSHLTNAEHARLSALHKEYSAGNALVDKLCNAVMDS